MAGLPQYQSQDLLQQISVVRQPDAGAGLMALSRQSAALASKLGTEAEKADVTESQAAAERTAMRDEEGNLVPTPPLRPDSGNHADAVFNARIRERYAAEFNVDNKSTAEQFRVQANGDPQAFKALWQAHAEVTLGAVDPNFKAQAQDLLVSLGNQEYNGLLVRKQAQDNALAETDWRSNKESQEQDLISLAASGGTNTPAYKQAIERFNATINGGIESRFIGPDQAANIRQQVADEGEAYAVAKHAVDAYIAAGRGADGQAAAQKLLDGLDDPNLKISERQRLYIRGVAQSQIAKHEAIRQQQVSAITDEAKPVLDKIHLGVNLPSGTVDELRRRLVAVGATKQAAELEQASLLQQQITAAGRQPLSVIKDQLAAIAPKMQDGTATELEAHLASVLPKVYAAKAEALKNDALSYGAQAHPDLVGTLVPVDWSKPPEEVIPQLQKRVDQASRLTDYEKVYTPPLTAGELGQLSNAIATMNADQRAALSATLADGLGPTQLPKVLSILMKNKDSDSRLFATAAGISTVDRETGRRILFGADVLKANKNVLPANDTQLRSTLQNELGDAFALRPDARGAVVQAAQALYAYDANAKGDFSQTLDRTRLLNAMDRVTGGVLDFNGHKIIAPERGMTQSQFDGVMDAIPDSLLAGAHSADGRPVTADLLRRYGTLRSIGDGRYQVKIGGYDVLAGAAPGASFVLDLRGITAKPPPGLDIPAMGGL